MTRVLRACLILAILALLTPATVRAQSLEHVETLVAQGRVQNARAELLSWWDGESADASRDQLQRGIWLRGVLTLDPGQAALDYTRLVVEFPGGPFTDRALQRLAMAADLSGDSVRAARHYRVLERDYPGSPLRAEAQRWLEAHPAAAAAPPRTSAREPEPEDAPARGDYTVQLGAFSQQTRARTLAEQARAAGFEPRLAEVPGSGLIRVRLGRFPDAAAAKELYDRVRAAGLDAAIVPGAERESSVGG